MKLDKMGHTFFESFEECSSVHHLNKKRSFLQTCALAHVFCLKACPLYDKLGTVT